MAHLLDTFSASQRKDVETLSSGYLNPDVSNRRMKGEMKARAEAAASAAGGAVDKSSASAWLQSLGPTYIPATPSEVQAPATNKQDEMKPERKEALDAVLTGTEPHRIAHNTTDLHDVLEKFDAVKLQEKFPVAEASSLPAAETSEAALDSSSSSSRKVTLPDLPAALRQRFVPNPILSMTKRDSWRTRQEIDTMLDRSTWMSSPKKFAKQDQLEKLYAFLERELEALQAPESGPDFRRLQVYSAVWDKVIKEFKLYGPVLSEIKNEYDKTVANFHNDQRELNFLRTKVQSLLSQNENRLLIKYERRKTRALEAKYAALEAENEQLKADLRRKLAMYAAYLPPSVLEQKKKDDPVLEAIGSEIKTYKLGEDPISRYENQIDSLSKDVSRCETEISDLRKSHAVDYVLRSEKDAVETALVYAEANLEELRAQNSALQKQVAEQQTELDTVTAGVKERQQQYEFLYKEYKCVSPLSSVLASQHKLFVVFHYPINTSRNSELSEAVARKFDASASSKSGTPQKVFPFTMFPS
ncbi:hypothetical protein PhCBS80983_g00742 [Powellomyces hirtus]|uniref:Translin-associated factor X-interacting protein 1 N-terminal domain-containing protein n=1 Tax=Powellomyces hirtus TaxID=109895 RepID=A0A507EEE7_9FUNG|nr:hypothetical protein PhCBS80983_g00742 [Powellomyces hirtus]